MISKSLIPDIKEEVQDFDSPIFQRYLKSELKCNHVCPVCKAELNDYEALYFHISVKHDMPMDNEDVNNALNPLYRVRKIYAERPNPEIISIGRFFGENIISDYNQCVMVNIIGPMGAGKSNAANRTGEATAEYIAAVKGGKPEDYFNINNIAIMRLDSIIPILEDIDNRKFNIIIMDDIGASYSARDFNKVINKNMNKILQTFRDSNVMIIITTPHTFLIDKVARKLAHFQIEMVEKRFDDKASVGKLLEVVDQYRNSGKTHYRFVQYNGVKYKRIVFKRASDKIYMAYEKKRKEIRMTLGAESIDNIRNDELGMKAEKPERILKHVMIAKAVNKKLKANPKITNAQLATELTTSRDTIRDARKYLQGCGMAKV
jgi:ATPase family associated with various cellular activities (AAA)